MNRRQRRSAVKTKLGAAPATPHPETQAPAAVAKPGFVLRFFANILLAPWVLKRVRHADMERLLAGVATQAGRPEIAASLLNRIAVRNAGKR
jgi:hypothetical protein